MKLVITDNLSLLTIDMLHSQSKSIMSLYLSVMTSFMKFPPGSYMYDYEPQNDIILYQWY